MEKAIFTNMCMISDNAGSILVQDRKKADYPGITFPGGHVEPGESFVESVIREVREETGLDIEVFWIPRDQLRQYPLAPDFDQMLRIFESDNLSEFYYYKTSGEWALKLL